MKKIFRLLDNNFVFTGVALAIAGAYFVFTAPLVTDVSARLDVANAPRPIVLELYTSQGCSSCPPADQLLAQMAQDDQLNVLPLSFHVDYWNRLGWEDPWSDKRYSHRQRLYAEAMGSSSIYTPQLVIDGRLETIGSHPNKVFKKINQAAKDVAYVPLSLRGKNGHLILDITSPKGDKISNADIILLLFDETHETAVGTGENRSRTIMNAHVVRDLKKIGSWSQKDGDMSLAINEKIPARAAILLQEEEHGKILGATVF